MPVVSFLGAVSAEVSQLLHVDAGAVMRFIGGERAVIVGVHRNGGTHSQSSTYAFQRFACPSALHDTIASTRNTPTVTAISRT